MAVTRRYTVQIVIMTTEDQGAWIKERAALYRVSEAQIARDTIALGQDRLAAHYAKIGLRPHEPVRKVPTKRANKRVPVATFVAPSIDVTAGM